MEDFDAKTLLQKNKNECDAAVSAFKRELQKTRTGRASASLLEGIHVDYYGSRTALSHLGHINCPEPRQIIVQVFDNSAVESVEKAIRSADLGLNPSREGNSLRINIPPLTQETRKEIVKHLHKLTEDYRVSIRNHRRDTNEQIKAAEKESLINKDDAKRTMDQVQQQVDKAIADVEALLKSKEAEVMEV